MKKMATSITQLTMAMNQSMEEIRRTTKERLEQIKKRLAKGRGKRDIRLMEKNDDPIVRHETDVIVDELDNSNVYRPHERYRKEG